MIGRSDKSGKSENIVVLSQHEKLCSREEEAASTGVCGKRSLQSLVGRGACSCRSKRRGEATNEEQRMPRGADAETKRDYERKRDENALLGARVLSSLFGSPRYQGGEGRGGAVKGRGRNGGGEKGEPEYLTKETC